MGTEEIRRNFFAIERAGYDMIPIKIYDIVHNAIRINMSDESFLYDIENCPSNKINSIDYVNEDGSIGFILTLKNAAASCLPLGWSDRQH